MASITGFPARRWSLAALLRWLQAPIAAPTAETTVTGVPPGNPAPRRRRYPVQRDRVFEQAAMAREMYRL
mgnify:CR=1 FL=1|jgi:hypothetical protein